MQNELLESQDLMILICIKDRYTIREMRSEIGVRSSGSVYTRIKFLIEKGYVINPNPRASRSYKLTEAGERQIKLYGIHK